ncbi:hypothetical protein [Nonomuraea guangzhouensis]|uniref:Uncharacterized protein n=1 Tax=Nonomuraea guangzhouensis TaxID=1291555 RepID=A0ABW4G9C8_9ACTN|nr:hypothetical protein [Nonomuraea guangzhouensis]
MVRRQANVSDVEAANLANPELMPTRRRHAEAAVAWATADRELILQHETLLLSALR